MMAARKLLYPFSLMYGGITLLRNKMYDEGILKSSGYDVPIICVGNLSVGGTGKSPMVEYLATLLKKELEVATLSRGYKRNSSGFLLLTGAEKAAETGDEPLQFKRKFPDLIVAVDESRRHGIEELLKLRPKPDVILLDDAFQHRKVTAGLNILLTPYDNIYSRDMMLPAGNLREPVSGAGRAQIIVVTKCPTELSANRKKQIAEELSIENDQELFFSRVVYAEEVHNSKAVRELASFMGRDFTLVTGIANPQPLVEHLKNLGLRFEHLRFPDHHNFTASELIEISDRGLILTTEKDFMRLKDHVQEDKLFYLPIRTAFLQYGGRFDQLIKSFAIKK